MKRRERPAALARMKYLGTFQVRAGLATNKIGRSFQEGKGFSRPGASKA
jgi:hypothetical protein